MPSPTKLDMEAAKAAHEVICSFAQYTYTLSVLDALKIIRAAEKVRKNAGKNVRAKCTCAKENANAKEGECQCEG